MRKISLLLVFVLLFASGCSGADVPEIGDHEWVMTSVQSMEEDGQAVAFGERGSSTLPSAEQMEMFCIAENGNLTIDDRTNGKTYSGTYKMIQKDPRSSIYEVDVEGTEGMAVVAMMAYQDGSSEPTFIISLGSYTINFASLTGSE